MTDNKNPKTLIVYYSHSGNTRFIAEAMAGAAGADLAELLPKKEINLSGAAYVGWGVRQLLRKDEREVEPIPYDIKDYDLIIVGTPVWTFTLTPPMRAFLKTHDFSGKDVAVFCCNDGDKGHTLEDLAESMPGSRCIGKIDFQSVLKSDPDSAAERAEQWVKDLLASR